MLRQLHISGLGVVEDLDLEFDPGLNVLTGETGAGKTMITVGLALALGQRASASLVRQGSAAARVEALFDAIPEAVAGGWAVDGDLVLARQVGADGKGSARIGGQIAPVATLADLAEGLVEVHGQHQGAKLLSPAVQMRFIDRYVGREHVARLEGLARSVARLRDLQRQRDELLARAADREREIDFLAFQVREIEAADPQVGELATLQAEAGRLEHAERLLARASEASADLGDEDRAEDLVSRAAAALAAASDHDPSVTELAARAREAAALVAELSRDVRDYREGVGLDPERLEEINARIALLRSLMRKYGEGEDALLAHLDGARARLADIDGADDRARSLEADIAAIAEQIEAEAGRIGADRRAAAPTLGAAIEVELRELGMPDASVRIDLVPLDEIGPAGAERPEISFSGGANQPLQPLAKVASGGELSRAMLALRSVLIDLDDTPTLVFDEVDAGIGGRAGVAVGRRLARLASSRQVLVVTHLPQIAAFADRHIHVEKADGTARVSVLADAGRVAELSRMLSGMPGSEAAATHAEELLAEAVRAKSGG